MKMWAGRFREPLEAGFERWQRSFPFDRCLLAHELAASRAYARALRGAGVLSEAELEKILDALQQIEQRARQPGGLEDERAEDVHHFVELRLVERLGDLGGKLHTGRSRNEQIATDLRLFARESLDRVQARLAEWLEALLARAAALRAAAMPAYTHGQRAEPVLAAHWLLAYAEMFFRDADRLADCRRRVDVLPLGSGAVAGAGLPLDRAALARELGFARVSANSVDATSDRDFELEFLHALAFVALHLSRWAEEMALFSGQEFGFVRLPDRFATGSSAMPQKKNPDLLELLRGKTGRVVGAPLVVALTLKGLPLAYNRDLQETQEPLFDAVDSVVSSLEVAASFCRNVEFDTARMQAAASSGFLNATAAAMYLVQRGVPFRRAHTVVGQLVRRCLEAEKDLATLSLEELRQASPEFAADFYEAISLPAVLRRHDLPGGTAPGQVERALAEAQQRLATLRRQADARA